MNEHFLSEEKLYALLDAQGIQYQLYEHPPLYRVEEALVHQTAMPDGFHTKNMFLRDKQRQYYLFTVAQLARVDLKKLAKIIGAKGNLSFGTAEDLFHFCGVVPGSVTAVGILNDTEHKVTFYMDQEANDSQICYVHPLRNDKTLAILGVELTQFIRQYHQVHLIDRSLVLKEEEA